MGRRLAYHLGSRATVDPGQYCEDFGEKFICCPNCATVSLLTMPPYELNYRDISPRWECPACPYQDWLTLDQGE